MKNNGLSPPMHAAIVAFFNAVLQLIVSFGVTLTTAQDAGITTVFNAALILVSILWTRTGAYRHKDAVRALSKLTPVEQSDVHKEVNR